MILILAALLLAACAGRDRQPIYVQSDELAQISAPEGLDPPQIRPSFQVAGVFLPEMAGQGDTRPPRVLPSSEAERSRSHIRFGPRGLFLEVQDQSDSVWQRLGFSLNRAGMEVREVREQRRQYAFRFNDEVVTIDRTGLARLTFWRRMERMDFSGDFVAEVEAVNDRSTRVLLFDSAGQLVDMNQAERVLAILRDRLG